MDLFTDLVNNVNLLPYNGEVIYHGMLLNSNESDRFFKLIMEKAVWMNDRSVIYGKEIITKRKVAWYGSKEFSYTYSGCYLCGATVDR